VAAQRAWGGGAVAAVATLRAVCAGVLRALAGRGVAAVGALGGARAVEARLREAVAGVAERLVAAPVAEVLARLAAARAAATQALGGGRPRRRR